MSDIKKFEPLWGVWTTEVLIGEGSFGKVYRAVREEFGKKYYAAVKHISIPASESQISEAISEGVATDLESAKGYFGAITQNLVNEITLMSQVKGHSNIVSYEDHMIIPKPSGVGHDIVIRMELLTGLNDVLRHRQMTNRDVIKLGIDICSALEVCLEKGIIHRDIKPSNIFVNDTGDYKLGDFGVAREMAHTTSGMSKKGTYVYMAPEVYRGEPANFTADTFSLGIVMYRLLNGNRAPFLPVGAASVSPADNETALARRMSGEPLPVPAFAEGDLAAVILRATQFDKSKRFANPTEFKKALQNVRDGIPVERTIPVIAAPTDNRGSAPRSAGFASAAEDNTTVAAEGYRTAAAGEYNTTVAARPAAAVTNTAGGNKDTRWFMIAIVMMLALMTAMVVSCAACTMCNGLSGTGMYGDSGTETGQEVYWEPQTSPQVTTTTTRTTTTTTTTAVQQTYRPEKVVIGGQTVRTDVTRLALGWMRITDISDLQYFWELEELYLHNNGITDISALASCTNLRELNLRGNSIRDISALANCKKLENLDLGENKVSDISVLANSDNLLYLYLDRNNVYDISVLPTCKNLTRLSVHTNPISDVSMLKDCRKLSFLHIKDCNLSDAQIREIRNALPGCTIHSS